MGIDNGGLGQIISGIVGVALTAMGALVWISKRQSKQLERQNDEKQSLVEEMRAETRTYSARLLDVIEKNTGGFATVVEVVRENSGAITGVKAVCSEMVQAVKQCNVKQRRRKR
jgi:formiminotetrahydrofolate cyclodeaminase